MDESHSLGLRNKETTQVGCADLCIAACTHEYTHADTILCGERAPVQLEWFT